MLPACGCWDCTSGRDARSCLKLQMGQATSLYLEQAKGMRGWFVVSLVLERAMGFAEKGIGRRGQCVDVQ